MDAVDFSRGPGTPPDPQRVTPTTASPQCTRGRLRRAGRFLFPFLYAALPAPCTLRAAFDVPFGPQAHSLLEELQVRLPSRQRQPAALAPAAAYATAGASAPFRCIVATTLSTPPSLPRRAASGPAPSRRDSASQDSPSQHGGALRAAPPPNVAFGQSTCPPRAALRAPRALAGALRAFSLKGHTCRRPSSPPDAQPRATAEEALPTRPKRRRRRRRSYGCQLRASSPAGRPRTGCPHSQSSSRRHSGRSPHCLGLSGTCSRRAAAAP